MNVIKFSAARSSVCGLTCSIISATGQHNIISNKIMLTICHFIKNSALIVVLLLLVVCIALVITCRIRRYLKSTVMLQLATDKLVIIFSQVHRLKLKLTQSYRSAVLMRLLTFLDKEQKWRPILPMVKLDSFIVNRI